MEYIYWYKNGKIRQGIGTFQMVLGCGKVPLESGLLHVYVQFSHASVPIVDLLICLPNLFNTISFDVERKKLLLGNGNTEWGD